MNKSFKRLKLISFAFIGIMTLMLGLIVPTFVLSQGSLETRSDLRNGSRLWSEIPIGTVIDEKAVDQNIGIRIVKSAGHEDDYTPNIPNDITVGVQVVGYHEDVHLGANSTLAYAVPIPFVLQYSSNTPNSGTGLNPSPEDFYRYAPISNFGGFSGLCSGERNRGFLVPDIEGCDEDRNGGSAYVSFEAREATRTKVDIPGEDSFWIFHKKDGGYTQNDGVRRLSISSYMKDFSISVGGFINDDPLSTDLTGITNYGTGLNIQISGGIQIQDPLKVFLNFALPEDIIFDVPDFKNELGYVDVEYEFTGPMDQAGTDLTVSAKFYYDEDVVLEEDIDYSKPWIRSEYSINVLNVAGYSDKQIINTFLSPFTWMRFLPVAFMSSYEGEHDSRTIEGNVETLTKTITYEEMQSVINWRDPLLMWEDLLFIAPQGRTQTVTTDITEESGNGDDFVFKIFGRRRNTDWWGPYWTDPDNWDPCNGTGPSCEGWSEEEIALERERQEYLRFSLPNDDLATTLLPQISIGDVAKGVEDPVQISVNKNEALIDILVEYSEYIESVKIYGEDLPVEGVEMVKVPNDLNYSEIVPPQIYDNFSANLDMLEGNKLYDDLYIEIVSTSTDFGVPNQVVPIPAFRTNDFSAPKVVLENVVPGDDLAKIFVDVESASSIETITAHLGELDDLVVGEFNSSNFNFVDGENILTVRDLFQNFPPGYFDEENVQPGEIVYDSLYLNVQGKNITGNTEPIKVNVPNFLAVPSEELPFIENIELTPNFDKLDLSYDVNNPYLINSLSIATPGLPITSHEIEIDRKKLNNSATIEDLVPNTDYSNWTITMGIDEELVDSSLIPPSMDPEVVYTLPDFKTTYMPPPEILDDLIEIVQVDKSTVRFNFTLLNTFSIKFKDNFSQIFLEGESVPGRKQRIHIPTDADPNIEVSHKINGLNSSEVYQNWVLRIELNAYTGLDEIVYNLPPFTSLRPEPMQATTKKQKTIILTSVLIGGAGIAAGLTYVFIFKKRK